MPFFESNEDSRGFAADQWQQQAQGRVADQWAASAVADAPDRAAAAEQAAQQAAQQQAAAQAQAAAEAQRQAQEQAQQQAAAAAEAARQQAAAQQAAADQWAGQAQQQAASVASTATDAASLAPSQMPQQATIDSSSPEAFIRSITPWAQQISQQTGIPAAAMIGMAANETGYGKFAAGNNLFGIKGSGPAGSINSQTWEDYGSGPVTIRSNFRAYANPGESFQDFADLVTNAPRYAAAKGQTTVEGFVQALKDGGYMTDPAYVGKISSIVQRFGGVINDALQGAGQAVGGAVQGAGQAAQDAGAGAARVVQGAVNTVIENLRPSQFAVGLDSASAYAACGPVAAIAFARAMGRNPTAQEAVQLAKQVGWTAAQGMAGPGSELSLLTSMGVPAHMENGADVSKMATDVGNGNPVIISTPGHYFVADGYDPQSGAFHVGTSGTDLRRGSEWMTLGQMQNVMGNVQATLFLDRQPGDGPSVAAQARGQQPGTPGSQPGQPAQPRAQTMAQFIQQHQAAGLGMPTDEELGNFVLSQPSEQTAASVGQPQPIQQPSSPFDVVGNLASGLGGAVSGAVSGVGNALGGLFGRGGPGGQPPGGPTETAPTASTSPFPGLPQLPTGMPLEGGGYGAGGPLLPGEAASAFAPIGQAVTGLAQSPLLPTSLTNAGLQAIGQNVVAPGLEAIAQPGGLLAGPRAAVAGGLEGLAGQVPAGVPLVAGALQHAAGFIGAPTIVDAAQTASQIEQKYGGGLQTGPDGRATYRPPDYSQITPEDQSALSNAMLAVGGVTQPPGPEAGGSAAERAAAETGGAARQAPALSTQESNFLRSPTIVPISDPRPADPFNNPGLPNVKGVVQQNLAEVLPGDAVLYHETSVPNARAILQRVEAGPRNQSIWTADTRDLALGQGGKGVMLEFDPALVNGGAGASPTKAFSAEAGMGTEYQLDKTLRGAVQAIVVNTQRQADQLAADPLITNRFDFSAAQQTPEGIRIPYAGQSRVAATPATAGTPVESPTTVGSPVTTPTTLERFGLTDRPVEGAAPLSDDDLLSHYQGLEQQYEANNVQIARLADQLHEARNPGVAPIRPQWAVGLPNEAVIKIANDHGVSPYREDWWEQAGLSQGSQEVSRLLSEGGYRGVGTRRLGGSQLQNAQAELDRLRAENQAITDHLDPLTAAEPGTLYRAPAQPAELPFAPPTDVVQSASREPTTAAGAPAFGPPTPVGRSEAIAAATPTDLGVREGAARVGAEVPAAAPVNGTAGGNLPIEQMPEVQRVREAANPPAEVNPADNGIPPPPGEPPRPTSTDPGDFDANVRAAVEQEARKPGSFWQVLNAFHSGNVIMGPFTLGKVAANTMFQPVWNFGTQTARDLLTLKPDRVMGRSIGAQQALVSIGSDFMDAFAQAMANRTTSSIPLVDHFLQAQQAVGGALHAGMQNVAAEAVRRMELGAAAGEQVAAQGGRSIEGLGKIADLIRDSSGLSDDAVFRAADMADRAGLRSPAGAVQQTVQNMLNQAANTPVGAVANFLLPVFRIGAQAAARGIEASPFGLIGTGIDVARAGAGFGPYAKGFSQYGQAVTPLADRLTSNIAGTALTAFLASKSLDGTITGTGPDDPKARANLEAQGWRPESVLVPGVGYVSFTRLPEQLRTPLELAGAFGDAVREHPDDPQGIAGRLAQEVGKTMAQGLPGLSTLADIGGILKGDPYAIGYLVGGSAAGYIPGSALLGNVATALDPFARKIPTTQGFGAAIGANIEQSIPGLREQLQPRVSTLGQPMPNPAAGVTGLLPWRTPGEIAPGTPGLQALRVLNANGVTLTEAPKTVTLGNGSRVDLTDDEQQQYEADRAVLLDQMTSGLVNNQQFAAAPGAARKQVLDRLIRQADAVAGRQVVGAIAQGGDFASRLQGPKRLEEPTPAIRPPLALTELNSAAAPAQAPSRAALPLTSDLATMDPLQQEQLRRQLAGTP